MALNRRDFAKGVAAGLAGIGAVRAEDSPAPPVRIGMTDWNLGQRGDTANLELARRIGLDGIQISILFPEDGSLHLRDPKVQEEFRKAALANGIQICSLAIGSPGKSRLPLHTNPAAAILLVEAVDAAARIGTTDILLPVLGQSHINMQNQAEVDTFVAMMKEVARYAEKAGVIISLEDWLSAEDNMRLLDAIGSDYVGVYYDPHNVKVKVHDPYGEAKILGQRIHQIHVKNARNLLRDPGLLDWPRLAEEFYQAGYRGWYVLETSSPSQDLIKDTRDNIQYIRKTFRIPAGG